MLNDSYIHLLLVFFLPSARPPSSTLFPYTTLFRSAASARAGAASSCCCAMSNGRRCRPHGMPPSDRKSTRLNSSHLVISYAVFCLKKKKKHNKTDHTKTHVR